MAGWKDRSYFYQISVEDNKLFLFEIVFFFTKLRRNQSRNIYDLDNSVVCSRQGQNKAKKSRNKCCFCLLDFYSSVTNISLELQWQLLIQIILSFAKPQQIVSFLRMKALIWWKSKIILNKTISRFHSFVYNLSIFKTWQDIMMETCWEITTLKFYNVFSDTYSL